MLYDDLLGQEKDPISDDTISSVVDEMFKKGAPAPEAGTASWEGLIGVTVDDMFGQGKSGVSDDVISSAVDTMFGDRRLGIAGPHRKLEDMEKTHQLEKPPAWEIPSMQEALDYKPAHEPAHQVIPIREYEELPAREIPPMTFPEYETEEDLARAKPLIEAEMGDISENTPYLQQVKDVGLLIARKHPAIRRRMLSKLASGLAFGNEEYFYNALEKITGKPGIAEAMKYGGEEELKSVLGYYPKKGVVPFEMGHELAGAFTTLNPIFRGAGIAAKVATKIPALRALIRTFFIGSTVGIARRPGEEDTLGERIKQVPGDLAFFGLFEIGVLTAGQALKIAKWNKRFGKTAKAEAEWITTEYGGKPGGPKEFNFTENDIKKLFHKMEENSAGRGAPLTATEAEFLELMKLPPGWSKALKDGWIGELAVPGEPGTRGMTYAIKGQRVPRKPRWGDVFKRIERKDVPVIEGEPEGETWPTDVPVGGQAYETRWPGRDPYSTYVGKKYAGKGAAPARPTEPVGPGVPPAEPGVPPAEPRVPPVRRAGPLAPLNKTSLLDPKATVGIRMEIGPEFYAETIKTAGLLPGHEVRKTRVGKAEVKKTKARGFRDPLLEFIRFQGGVKPSRDYPQSALKDVLPPSLISNNGKTIDDLTNIIMQGRGEPGGKHPGVVIGEAFGGDMYPDDFFQLITKQSNSRVTWADGPDAEIFSDPFGDAELTDWILKEIESGRFDELSPAIKKAAEDLIINLDFLVESARKVGVRKEPFSKKAAIGAMAREFGITEQDAVDWLDIEFKGKDEVYLGQTFPSSEDVVDYMRKAEKPFFIDQAFAEKGKPVIGEPGEPSYIREGEPGPREAVSKEEALGLQEKYYYDVLGGKPGTFDPSQMEPTAFKGRETLPFKEEKQIELFKEEEKPKLAKGREIPIEVQGALKGAPEELKSLVDIKRVIEREFPPELEGMGGKYLPREKTLAIEKGEADVNSAIRHEAMHNVIEKFGVSDKPWVSNYIKEAYKDRDPIVTRRFLADLKKSSGIRGVGGFHNPIEEALAGHLSQYVANPEGLPSKIKNIFDSRFKPKTKEMIAREGIKKLTPAKDKQLKKEQLTETVIDITKGKKGRKKDLVATEELKKELPGVLKRMNLPRERWGSLTAERLLKGGFDPSLGVPVEGYIRTLLAKHVFDKDGNIKDKKERPIPFSELAASDLLNIKPALMGATVGDPSVIFRKEDAKQKIRDVLSDYLPKERDFDIVASRVLKDYPDTFEVIGKRHGISNQRAQQIWNEAVGRLRKNKDFVKWIEDNLSWKGMGPAPSPKDLRKMNLIWHKFFTTSRGVSVEISRANQERSNVRMALLFKGSKEVDVLRKWLKKQKNPQVDEFIHRITTSHTPLLDLYAIPDEIKDSLKVIRARVDRLTDMIILYADLPLDTQDILRDNMGEYLIGRYRAFEKTLFKPDPEMKRKYAEYLRETRPDDFGAHTEEEMDIFLREELNKFRKDRFKRKPAIAISGEQLYHKEKMSKAKRDYYGEIIDVPWLYMQTLVKQTSMAYNAKFLDTVATHWGKYWTDDAIEAGKKGWQNTRIPNEMGYGKLKNKFVAPELYDYITGIFEKEMGWIRRTVENFIVQPFKWNRTIGVPAGHGRNLFANPMFAILGEVSPFNPMNLQYYAKFTKWAVGRSGKYVDEWANLIRHGIVGTQFWGAEVGKLYEDLIKLDPATWPEKIWAYTKKPGKATVHALGELWNFGDTLFRGAAYIKYTEHFKMSPQLATEKVDRSFPNYKNLPAVVDFLRKVPIMGTFVSFNANVVKIFFNQVARGLAEMEAGLGLGSPLEAYGGTAEGDLRGGRKPPEPPEPGEPETKGARNPDPKLFWRGMRKWLMAALMLNAADIMVDLSMKISGVDVRLAKAFDKFRNTFQKGGKYIWIPWKGGFKLFDLTYIWPPAEFPNKTAASFIKLDLAGIASSANVLAHPMIDAVNILINGKVAGYDRDLPQTDTDLGNLGQRIMEFAKFIWVPQSAPIPAFKDLMKDLKIKSGPWTPRNTAKVLDAYWQKPDYYGKVKDLGEETKNFFTGLKTWDVDVDRTIIQFINRQEKKIKLLRGDIVSWAIDNPHAPQWKVDEYAKSKEKLIEGLNKKIAEADAWYEEFLVKGGFRVKK